MEQRLIKCFSQALRNREAKTKAFAAVALRVAELMKLFEYFALLRWCNADASVPYLEHGRATFLSANHQQTAAVGVTNGVGDQVAQNQLDQRRVCWRSPRGAARPRRLGRSFF